MAINRNTRYGSNFNPPTASYPQGSFKNETSEGAEDGSYLEQDFANDQDSLFQALLLNAGVTANGTVDTAQVSQYFDAMRAMFKPNLGKNLLINSTLNENQRVVSGTVVLAANVYGHDRMRAGASGCTYTFAKVGNYTAITITAGSLQQVVEADANYGGNHVLSWGGTAQGRINGGSYGATGAVITNVVAGTEITTEFNTGTLWLPQLEKGAIQTEIEYILPGENLSRCQEYYLNNVQDVVLTLAATTSNARYSTVQFPVTMRATPSTITVDGVAVYTQETEQGFRMEYDAGNTTSVITSSGYTADAEIY